eukprot:5404_1
MGNVFGQSNEGKVLAIWTEEQSHQHQTYFDLYIDRFGWGDQRNYIYISRSVIYSGVKDHVLAKYDDFMQNSILTKTAERANVSMPDFIHDHYVDYLMGQIRTSMNQLSYPDIKYVEDQINLKTNSEDGNRYWLLLGAINGKMCVDERTIKRRDGRSALVRRYYVRFSFKVAVYSSSMDKGIPDKDDDDDDDEAMEGNETRAPLGIEDRIKYLQGKEKEKKKRAKQRKQLEIEKQVLDAVIQESLEDMKQKEDDVQKRNVNMDEVAQAAEVDEKRSELIITTNDKYQKCPNVECGVYIERAYGCKHMKCPHCKVEFCDSCGEQVDPKNWKKHYLPPNKCRLWDDIDDLLNGNEANANKGNDVNVEEMEEGNIYLDVTDEKKMDISEKSLDENIIKQLIDIGIGNREQIVHAMKNVVDPNNAELVANFLLFKNRTNATAPTAPIPFTGGNTDAVLWQCHQCYNKNKAMYLFCPLCGAQKDTASNTNDDENTNIAKND